MGVAGQFARMFCLFYAKCSQQHTLKHIPQYHYPRVSIAQVVLAIVALLITPKTV